jgi:hypothetical protein
METNERVAAAIREADREFLPLVIRTMLEHGRGDLDETLGQIIAELRADPLMADDFDPAFKRERDAVRKARRAYERAVRDAAARLAAVCLGDGKSDLDAEADEDRDLAVPGGRWQDRTADLFGMNEYQRFSVVSEPLSLGVFSLLRYRFRGA